MAQKEVGVPFSDISTVQPYKDSEQISKEFGAFINENAGKNISKKGKDVLLDSVLKKAEQIANEGYGKLVGIENVKLAQSANYVGAKGAFDPSKVANCGGINFCVATFENKDGQKRYVIVDEDLNLRKESLAKLKYYEAQTKNLGTQEYYQTIKDVVVPELAKRGIGLNVPSTFMLFKEYDTEYLIENAENIANIIAENMKRVVIDINTFNSKYAETMRTEEAQQVFNNSLSQKTEVNDIMHELYNCGQNRQLSAIYATTGLDTTAGNSAEAKYMATAVAKCLGQVAKNLFMNNEITLNVDEADKLRVSRLILNEIIKSKNTEKLDEFLIHNNKPFPPSLRRIIDRAIEKMPEKIDISKINSGLIKTLAEMRRKHPELTNKGLANKAILEYITAPSGKVDFKTFRELFSEKDFFTRFEKGETLMEIAGYKEQVKDDKKAVGVKDSLDNILKKADDEYRKEIKEAEKQDVGRNVKAKDEQGAI